MGLDSRIVSRSPYYAEIEKTFQPEPPKQRKADRAAAIDALTVTVGGNTYQVDEISLLRIGMALTTAAARFNQGLAANPTAPREAVYAVVYQNTPIWWRTADDINVSINVETLTEIMDAGSEAFTDVWFRY